MPATSAKQRRFMRAELGRKRAGQKPKTSMTEEQLAEYAAGPVKKTPRNTRAGKKKR